MDLQKIVALNSTREANLNYGHALITQKGGWTLAEFSKPIEHGVGDFTGEDVEGMMYKVSQPERTPERAS